MSGPVWRYEANLEGTCEVCLGTFKGFFVEGSVEANALVQARTICPACFAEWRRLLVSGSQGSHIAGPAYAR